VTTFAQVQRQPQGPTSNPPRAATVPADANELDAAPTTAPSGAGHDIGRISLGPPPPPVARKPAADQGGRGLAVGAADSANEREADRMAERAIRAPLPRTGAGGSDGAGGRIRATVGPVVQARAGGDGGAAEVAPASVGEVLSSPGRSLDPATRVRMEQRFGHDFSQVRLHAGGAAERSASELSALAYTVGNHIVFGEGRYAPGTPMGQRLIAHELAHVVQQAVAVPVVQRDPDPQKTPPGQNPPPPGPKSRDPAAEVRTILSSRTARKDLSAWLNAHPADRAVAEKTLLDKATSSTVERELELIGDLISEVFARDPGSSARAALRNQVKHDAEAAWNQYAAAAAIATISQWSADGGERNRILSKITDRTAKADAVKSFTKLRSDADKLLKDFQKDRGPLMKQLQHDLSVMPLRTSPAFDPVAEQDLVTRILLQLERTIGRAEGIRVQSFELQTAKTPSSTTSAEIKNLDKQRDEAEASVKAAQKEFDDAKKLTGPGAAAKVRTATSKFQRAQDRRNALAANRAKASPAAARAIKFREDPKEAQRVTTALAQATSERNSFVKAQAAKLPAFDSLADDDAKWWVYWQFLKNARDGFEGFPVETTLRPLLLARNKMITRPEATGIQAKTSPDTYSGHGWGQYDLNAPAGTKVDVVEPKEIDLSTVLGGSPRTFEWAGSRVSAVFGTDPRQTEKDVLDKLAYGFFGRDRAFEKKIEQTDVEATGLPPNRTPEPNRLVAGLLYRSTVEGTELEIEDQLVQLHADLEQLLEASDEFKGLRVNEDEEILTQTFDASTGDFGTPNLLNPAAFTTGGKAGIPGTVLRAFNAAVSRILKEDNEFTRAVFLLMKQRLEQLRATGGVEPGHLGVLDWAGPSVFVLHKYKLKGGSEEAWIRVIYLHLHKAEAKVGKLSKDPLTVGQVGSGGNAISPHVHMAISVFRSEPAWNTLPIDYIDPTDFFGMVPRSPFKTSP
jgi:hypothetical protein